MLHCKNGWLSSKASDYTMCMCMLDTRFTRPTDRQINATLTDATRRVSDAVNRTRVDLRSARTAHHLLQLVRYPPSHALNLARSAEIFEQTMEALLTDVNAGHTYNLTGDSGQSSSLCRLACQYEITLHYIKII